MRIVIGLKREKIVSFFPLSTLEICSLMSRKSTKNRLKIKNHIAVVKALFQYNCLRSGAL